MSFQKLPLTVGLDFRKLQEKSTTSQGEYKFGKFPTRIGFTLRISVILSPIARTKFKDVRVFRKPSQQIP